MPFVFIYGEMNKRNTKKSFGTFKKRNTHKRKTKERSDNALLRALNEVNAKKQYKQSRVEINAEGIYSSSKSGFGFVSLEGEERDVFIPEGKTLGALDGDKVEIIYHKYYTSGGEEKTEGRVKRITIYGKKYIIGTVMPADSLLKRHMGISYVLEPDDPKFSAKPVIFADRGIKPGDKIKAKLLRKNSYMPECEPIINFGSSLSKEANYKAILDDCEINTDFTKEELAEADFFSSLPISYEGRRNLTGQTIFTIDSESAKDLDDAISLKKLKNGWQLGVHIADVSYYIKERSHLDRAVMARGTSVYFTDKVIPMLPESLSNGACSLNAGEEKYALSAIINLSSSADINSVEIVPTVIKSKLKGVYSEVNKIFDGTAAKEIKEKYKAICPALKRMYELYTLLKNKSKARGALELDSPEAEILLDETGTPCGLIKRERGDAEKLIEQFMLTANEAVASLLYKEKIPCVYRIHEPPSEEKLSAFLTYAHNMGFNTSVISKDKCSPRDFSKLLTEAEGKGLSIPLSYTMLRSMSKAKYSEHNLSHFGLGIEKYCHFTSPIRRLSDLATHRIIHKVLLDGGRSEVYNSYARRAAAAASEAELRAQNAERRIENLYKVIYMSDHIGEEFDAIITSVTSFGFFCMPENTCEGLVPISELEGTYIFDEERLTLSRGKMRYALGDTVRVRLEEADIIKGKLRYSAVV